MSYTAIYRKFRPKIFDEVIGQDTVVAALSNQVESGNVSHAYLFSGSRGTGKTSCAKIFARAINCLQTVKGSPCGVCSCCSILEKDGTDIIEIDAASNNGVNEIRDIREKIQFLPIAAKYKVYIIDEVHMLTDSAFNALLKTLEEPPAHAIFILATTESHKLPATILSRCMRFEFALVPQELLERHLKNIFIQLGIKSDEESIKLIAKCAEGGVRDLLSLADMCNSYCNGNLTADKVFQILGVTNNEKLFLIAKSIIENDIENLFLNLTEALQRDSVFLLNKNFIEYFRNIAIAKTAKNAQRILSFSQEDFDKICEIANLYELSFCIQIIEILSGIEYELKYSLSPKILLEANLLKCINIRIAMQNVTRADEIKSAEYAKEAADTGRKDLSALKINDKNKTAAAERLPHTEKSSCDNRQYTDAEACGNLSDNNQSESGTRASAERLWGLVILWLKENNHKMLYTISAEQNCTIQGNTVTVNCLSEQILNLLSKQNNLAILEKAVKAQGDYIINFSVQKSDGKNNELDEFKKFLGDKLKK